MNNRQQISFFVFLGIIAVIIVLFLYSQANSSKFNWNESYSNKNSQPYDLKLFYDILSEKQPNKSFTLMDKVPEEILYNSDTSALYIFVGKHFYIDSVGSKALIDFVYRGNNAFISSASPNYWVFDILLGKYFYDNFLSYHYDSIVKISFTPNFSDSVFKFHYKYEKKLYNYSWGGIDSTVLTDSIFLDNFSSISYLQNGLINCFSFKYGKGTFVYHFNPILLTNYNLSTALGLKYCNMLFSGFSKKNIYWDEYNKIPRYDQFSKNNEQSPLKFILSQRGLRWGWYILCIVVVLFVIFNSKRKQAYIPLIPENKNTSVDYIRSIAILHYDRSSLSYLSGEIYKQFLTFIKNKYQIPPIDNKHELARAIAAKTKIEFDEIRAILRNYYKAKTDTTKNSKALINFYLSVENFYKKCN